MLPNVFVLMVPLVGWFSIGPLFGGLLIEIGNRPDICGPIDRKSVSVRLILS